MFKKSLSIVTVFLLIVSMLAITAPAYAKGTLKTAKGTVVAIDKTQHTMTVRTVKGASLALKFSNKTPLTRGGKTSSTARMRVGDRVNVKFDPKTNQASEIEDTPGEFEFEGTIAAVDTTLNTVTVASEEGGSTVVLKVDANTVYLRNGAPATQADLLVGDKVEAKYDSTTMLASSIKTEMEDGEVIGAITAIDATLGTVTILPDAGGSAVTVKTSLSTVFEKGGALVTLAALQVGDQAEAKYDSVTLVASLISVEGH
jgi:hypothetical protein